MRMLTVHSRKITAPQRFWARNEARRAGRNCVDSALRHEQANMKQFPGGRSINFRRIRTLRNRSAPPKCALLSSLSTLRGQFVADSSQKSNHISGPKTPRSGRRRRSSFWPAQSRINDRLSKECEQPSGAEEASRLAAYQSVFIGRTDGF